MKKKFSRKALKKMEQAARREEWIDLVAQVAIPFAIQSIPGMKEQADANPGVEVQQ